MPSLNYKGGNFIADSVTGTCKTAAAHFDHVWHSKDGGVQFIISAQNDLPDKITGTLKNLNVLEAVRTRALQQYGGNAMRAVVKTAMAEMKLDASVVDEDDGFDG